MRVNAQHCKSAMMQGRCLTSMKVTAKGITFRLRSQVAVMIIVLEETFQTKGRPERKKVLPEVSVENGIQNRAGV